MITMYGIPNCDTVKKARVWMDQHGVAYAFHDYKKAGVDRAKLEQWVDEHGWETVLNRAGATFRKLPEADRSDLDREKAVALMKAGAVDLIERPFSVGRMLQAVNDCLRSLAARDAGRTRKRLARQQLAALTPRERQVFDGLIHGRSSKEIAQGLEISPRTVEVFRARVMDKMQAPHLPSLVRAAVLLGLPRLESDHET